MVRDLLTHGGTDSKRQAEQNSHPHSLPGSTEAKKAEKADL